MTYGPLPSVYEAVKHGTLGFVLATILLFQIETLSAVAPERLDGLANIGMTAAVMVSIYALLPYLRAAGEWVLHHTARLLSERFNIGETA